MKSRAFVVFVVCCLLGVVFSPVAQAEPQAAWSLTVTGQPSNLAVGKPATVFVVATNVGAKSTTGTSILEAVLPEGLDFSSAEGCSAADQVVTCETTEPIEAGDSFIAQIVTAVAAVPAGPASVDVTVSGGGATERERTIPLFYQSTPVPFQVLPPGLRAPFTEEDGLPASTSGSHPYQQSVSFQFPTFGTPDGKELTNSGHPHEIKVSLPAGVVGNPAATPVLCTEAQLEANKCPDESAVGLFEITTLATSPTVPAVATAPLFNMVTPPGAPAVLGTSVGSLGFFAHLIASVRSDGDYGIEVTTADILALGTHPIFGVQAQVWGDPSSKLHDSQRGNCYTGSETCPVEEQKTAFWTLPTTCSGQPLTSSVEGDTWEQIGSFIGSDYQSADFGGSPVSVTDCAALPFRPGIELRPTTSLTDSPSGLDVRLDLPTDTEVGHRATAALRDAVVTLPEGMTVNPSQADGLGACSLAQVGFLSESEGIHFSRDPASCPDSSKLGKVEVTTPLLVERDAETKIERDPETGKPILHPLHGSVYLAEPFDNPFGSLLALYLAVEDPKTGTIAKLAGRVEPDPQTGRLTTRFADNPQLPIETIELHLPGGARGPLITPPNCGTHTTTTALTPWSAPEAAVAHPESSFPISQQPGGGACPTNAGAAPNSPVLSAGTLSPQAGAYSPFVLKISREDGSQRLTGIDTKLAPGLIGKLAGIGQCSEAQIAQAAARSHPDEGILERESPSCPASARVGTVNVGAGAGPTPFYAQGTAYMAGPYKGAPLSLAVITPAIAGPFDLGTVVTRVALQIEPETAQIHAVSDPLPTILEGIPLDVRSVALRMDRPDFTLNPTSCDPMQITGTATTALGQAAALAQRFQVGGCGSLPFKPKLSLRLKGAVKRSSHPKLIATLTARPGEANIARAQVKLPRAVFLDQGHIGTVCTRVQFAVDACPARSVYGKVSATTPLLDYPLAGSVYLRSSNHELPDLVAKLEGPASQPIEIVLVGKTDAVRGALRNTFEAVPDAPVSKFRLELFGGKRGLVEMSDGFCASRRATVKLDGQNGKVHDTRPKVAAKCKKHKARKTKR